MAALRDNAGKPQLSFVLGFRKALGALARVFEQGAIKYERDNWRKGGKPDQEYLDSAMRHLAALGSGELYDPDTGCLHAAHVMWNMGALLELNTLSDYDAGNGLGRPAYPDLDPSFDQAAFEAKYRRETREWVDGGAVGVGRPAPNPLLLSGKNIVDL